MNWILERFLLLSIIALVLLVAVVAVIESRQVEKCEKMGGTVIYADSLIWVGNGVFVPTRNFDRCQLPQ